MIAFLSKLLRSVVLTLNNVLNFWQKKVNYKGLSGYEEYHARDSLPDKRTFVSQCWFQDVVCRNFASMRTS